MFSGSRVTKASIGGALVEVLYEPRGEATRARVAVSFALTSCFCISRYALPEDSLSGCANHFYFIF